MFKCFNVKMNKAMTLIEVLVVVAIMLILMAAVFINPRPSVELDNAVREFVSSLRSAQNMAMSVITQPGVVPGAYGITMTGPSTYHVLWYCWSDVNMSNSSFFQAHKGITVTVVPPSANYIAFRVPDGLITIRDDNDCQALFEGTRASVDFIFQATDGSTKTVTVTSAGKIEIE